MRIHTILTCTLLAAVLSLPVIPLGHASAFKYERSLKNITIPDVVLVNQSRKVVCGLTCNALSTNLKSFLTPMNWRLIKLPGTHTRVIDFDGRR